MRVLFVTTFYTALHRSLREGKWEPEGMPAVAKLMEALSRRQIAFDVLFVAPPGLPGFENKKTITLSKFSGVFNICTFPHWMRRGMQSKWLALFLFFAMQLRVIFLALQLLRRNSYDLIYSDRAQAMTGAFLAKVCRKPVFFRLHGVISLWEQFSQKKYRWLHPFSFGSYRAPFRYVLCSKDGTPTKPFLKNFLHPKTPYAVWLNGVDAPAIPEERRQEIRRRFSFSESRIVFLFVGNFGENKGIDVYLEAAEKAARQSKDFFTWIVGEGPYAAEAKRRIEETGLGAQIVLVGGVPHREIEAYYAASDVYVSLNRHGNLSNTVLEALAAGNAIITYDYDPKSGRDEDTREILGRAALYFDRAQQKELLPQIFLALLQEPQKIHQLRREAKKQAVQHLKSWDKRLQNEIELMQSKAGN